MILARRSRATLLALSTLAALCFLGVNSARCGSSKDAPTGGLSADAPRSRLTLSGGFELDAYSQKNFFLGARRDSSGNGEFDAFWTQRLTLRPRLILSDDLNFTMKADLARGVWGLPDQASGTTTGTGYRRSSDLLDLRIDQAYLSVRNRRTSTRWYLGRQQFALGNLLVLDEDSPGIQVWRDFGPSRVLVLGFAKESEAGTRSDDLHADSLVTPPSTVDGRDADLYLGELRLGREDSGVFLNPFFAYYLDRSNADGATLLPDGHEPDARFRPSISKATIAGIAASRQGERLRIDAELDWLKGLDRVRAGGARRTTSGPNETHDVNNGDLKGMNVYARITYTGNRLELTGTAARGSGDPDPFHAEGNINSLYRQGHWFLTEVWGNGLTLEDVGIAPQGLGNPDARGYRGLENTTALQIGGAYRISSSLKLGVSWTLIRSTQPVKPWWDEDGDGVISANNAHGLNEYGLDRFARPPAYHGGQTTELGSELDGRLDWSLTDRVSVTLRGGSFTPGQGAGFLINGTGKYLESPLGLRLSVTVPVPEFSLGG